MKHSPYKRSAQDSKALTGLFQGQDVAGREHKPWRTPSPRSSPLTAAQTPPRKAASRAEPCRVTSGGDLPACSHCRVLHLPHRAGEPSSSVRAGFPSLPLQLVSNAQR